MRIPTEGERLAPAADGTIYVVESVFIDDDPDALPGNFLVTLVPEDEIDDMQGVGAEELNDVEFSAFCERRGIRF